MKITMTTKEMAELIKELQARPDDLKEYSVRISNSLKQAIYDTQTEPSLEEE